MCYLLASSFSGDLNNAIINCGIAYTCHMTSASPPATTLPQHRRDSTLYGDLYFATVATSASGPPPFTVPMVTPHSAWFPLRQQCLRQLLPHTEGASTSCDDFNSQRCCLSLVYLTESTTGTGRILRDSATVGTNTLPIAFDTPALSCDQLLVFTFTSFVE